MALKCCRPIFFLDHLEPCSGHELTSQADNGRRRSFCQAEQVVLPECPHLGQCRKCAFCEEPCRPGASWFVGWQEDFVWWTGLWWHHREPHYFRSSSRVEQTVLPGLLRVLIPFCVCFFPWALVSLLFCFEGPAFHRKLNLPLVLRRSRRLKAASM